ncbi:MULTISPECIES: GNAT family N-acetyltransferase [unclassified Microbacterium]|uniref:GNAT family N-acetyltransferase n=1 Tax=unclassified Microbacterium TaxID=2609290 RepID=UPI0012F76CC4|nr:GNAT family N-acetyltransferase [Microbacterium sp. MAH-37]MVQ43201.1 GNAT family N-acetyltransferase [Microbacterium sp. MAH-37]
MPLTIRDAHSADLAEIEAVEAEADLLLIETFGAVDWPPPDPAAERASQPGFLLVGELDGKVVGFAHVLEVHRVVHLEQVAVLPRYGRRGIGRRLVEEALRVAADRGYEEITLRTYANVPWNAPFYASCGFQVSVPATDFHRGLISVEESLGLMRYGARVQMTASL